jgi:hypothetical protein
VQELYQQNPTLRPLMENVVVAAYQAARQGDERAIRRRCGALAGLVAAEQEAAPSVSAETPADLKELRQTLEIRRQMRREGLL